MTEDFNGQPHAIVERDGVRFTLLGTAHVSHSSVDAVRAAIDSGAWPNNSASNPAPSSSSPRRKRRRAAWACT